jgi:hypothetical protein
MAKRTNFWMEAMVLVFLSAFFGSPTKANPEQRKATGILTDRLSPKQTKAWESIRQVALAKDMSGQPQHPALYDLYQQAENSGYAIYVELPQPKGSSPYTCGTFSVEKAESGDQVRAGVVRLYLSTIESASTSGRGRRENGFAPFEKLNHKKLRYAEVLGHELVHALLTLKDLNLAHLSQELERETAELQNYRQGKKGEPLDQEMMDRLKRIQSISLEVEKQAEAVEMDVWRELLENQGN